MRSFNSLRLRLVVAGLLTCHYLLWAQAEDAQMLFPIKANGKYGYIDRKGTIAIKPKYDMADDFSEGLARVKLGSKWGYIGSNGEMLF